MLTIRNTEAIRQIEAAIGYTFHDKRLLIQVLTRKTYLKIDPEAPDNEVLEFYGDTLMNYHVTNYFMSKYAHMLDDGLFFMRTVEQFTDMRSHYVCNRYLTDRVKALGLSRYLRAQNRDAELRRDGEKAYADIFESLVGAIYLDSYQNDNLIRAFILRQLGIEPKRLPDDIEAFDYDSLSAPIPSLSEYREIPVTEESEIEAVLPVEAEDPASEILPAVEATPVDLSPVEAETAAETAILTEAIVKEAPIEPVLTPKQEALAALCRALGYELPTYGETPKNAPNARPVAACTLKYKDGKGKLVKISLNDSGKTLAEATEKAAAKMLKKLEKQVADATPKAEMPESAPTPVATVEVTPVEATPVEATPVEAASAEMIPAVETIAEEVVATDVVVEVAPAEAAVEVAPAEGTAEVAPAEETPVADAPAEVAPVAEVATEASPAEAASVEENAFAEAPAEEIPVTEAKAVEETPAVETVNPAKKNSSSKKSAVKRPNKAEPAAESSSPAEAPAEEAKPAKAKKAPAKKKAAPKEDKPAEEAVVPDEVVNSEVEAPTEELATAVKPAKKKTPSKKKAAPKVEASAEATKDDNR